MPHGRKKRKNKRRIVVSSTQQIKIIILQLVVLYLLFFEAGCSVTSVKKTAYDNNGFHFENIHLPYIPDSTFYIYNPTGRYSVYYDTIHRQAAWVAYILTSGDVKSKNYSRKNKFIVDNLIVEKGWPYSTTHDYTKTGYDRGHLLPSADRTIDQKENDATFVMSNISPQHPTLNRKIWNALEQDIRKIALKYDSLYIVTGPDLNLVMERIGKNEVSVTERFFKTLLVKCDGEYHTVSFVIPNNSDISGTHWDYICTVREAEQLLGYDFFHNLLVSLQEKIETAFDIKVWTP